MHHTDLYDKRTENFWFDFITEELIDRYGINTVKQGGLRVYTTIDLHYQQLARQAIKKELGLPGDPASAVVTEDPHNGHILAMAQSVPYSQNEFNLAAQGHRQPGSTFKAIVLADALAHGIDPFTTYYLSHTLPSNWLPGYVYPVTTFEGTSLNKEENLVTATVTSDNTIFAQLAADLGEQTVTQMAYAMGVTTHLSSYPAEALGGLHVGVSPLEMANVYATLADGGLRNKQISITKVAFPDHHVDRSWGRPHRVRVLSQAVTSVETEILHDNVLMGTATHSAITCPTAAKTGTTSDLIDAWLDGYNPDFATVVWIGYPNARISMTDVHGEPQQGGYIPAFIWHDYMSGVVHQCTPLPTPQSIDYAAFTSRFGAHTGATGASGPVGDTAPSTGTTDTQTSSTASGGTTGDSGTGGAGFQSPGGTPPPSGPGSGDGNGGNQPTQPNTQPHSTPPPATPPVTAPPATTPPSTTTTPNDAGGAAPGTLAPATSTTTTVAPAPPVTTAAPPPPPRRR